MTYLCPIIKNSEYFSTHYITANIVQLSIGVSSLSPELVSWCGSGYPTTTLHSKYSTLLIVFSSDSSDNDYRGFRIAYYAKTNGNVSQLIINNILSHTYIRRKMLHRFNFSLTNTSKFVGWGWRITSIQNPWRVDTSSLKPFDILFKLYETVTH